MCALIGSETAVAPLDVRGSGVVTRPRLLEQLREPGQVALLSAPAGSGKTILLRSWLRETAISDSVAWVTPDREEHDAQRFWLAVLDALRDTCAASALVRGLSAAPELDGWAIVDRLLEDLDSLDGTLWLVIDDLHELRSADARRQLERLLMRAPAWLRFVLSTRRDLPLGLHRLRLQGALTEIRAGDLRFTLEEARALFESAGVEVSESALATLHERTEGWAAGLRLATLSLAGHPDPQRLAAEFSGSERTVAEYLLAEVLDRQPEEVARLLLRTSVLERVNGPLADLLTGGSGGERILHDLERANAFVVSVDAGRRWFRYHTLFAELLALELRRTEPGEIPALHDAAAIWYAEHGQPVEAIRHAQAAANWSLAARLLGDHWFDLRLDGQNAALHELLTAFPRRVVRADPELLALVAADELSRGALEEAERCLDAAAKASALVPTERRERFQLRLAIRRLRIARQRGNLPAVVEEAEHLLAPGEASPAARPRLDMGVRALALIELGIGELWSARLEHIDQHLEQGIALARQIERPYVEIGGLSHWAMVGATSSYALAVQRSRQAIQLAEHHGWSDEPIVSVAYLTLGTVKLWQGRLDEAQTWLERAEHALCAEFEPAPRMLLEQNRSLLELARGRDAKALDAFQAAERYAEMLTKPHPLATRLEADRLRALLLTGRVEHAQQVVYGMDEQQLATGETHTMLGALRLAQGDPEAAIAAIAPMISDGAGVGTRHRSLIEAFLVEAIARDALGEPSASEHALERALDLAEPDGVLLPFLLHPAPALLERQSRNRTTHAALVSEILGLLAGLAPAITPGESQELSEPLSKSETRVLRYLPTNLSLRDIGNELYVSVHTVKTHTKRIYSKLDVHGRAEAVARARVLGLLAPASHRR